MTVLITVAISIIVTLVVLWLVLLIGLAWLRPRKSTLRDAARIVPTPSGSSTDSPATAASDEECALDCSSCSPTWRSIDIVPDIIPVVGYADDVILIAVVLRSVMRHASTEVVRRHWPGSPEGLTVLARLCRLPGLSDDQRHTRVNPSQTITVGAQSDLTHPLGRRDVLQRRSRGHRNYLPIVMRGNQMTAPRMRGGKR